jgi:type I restriction enzyme, S subunit
MTDLPNGWIPKSLSDVCLPVTKADPVTTGREKVRYVDIGSVNGDDHRLHEVARVDSHAAPSRCRQVIAGGDTVFSTVRPYLEKIAFIDGSLAGEFASTGFCVLRPGPTVLPRYLFHYSVSRQMLNQVLIHQRGVSYPAVLDKNVKAATIPVPPLEEQRQILGILEDHLSRLDGASESLTTAHRRSELLRAITLESLAPKDAPPRRLGELATHSGYGTSTKCVVDGPGVPVVRIPNLTGGRVDLVDEKRVAEASVDLKGLMLEQDDLLIVRTNGSRDLIGRAAVVQLGVYASFASYLIRFRLDPLQVRPQWVRVMLGTPSVRRVLEDMAASSAGQYNLGLKKLNSVSIPCPPIEDQDRLLARIDEQEWALESLRRSLAEGRSKAQSLRRSLLTAAFSGRLTGRTDDMEVVEEMAGV